MRVRVVRRAHDQRAAPPPLRLLRRHAAVACTAADAVHATAEACASADWKSHKPQCLRLCKVKAEGAVPAQQPVPPQPAAAGGAFKVTHETPAMLQKAGCFLTVHPNQRFRPGVLQVADAPGRRKDVVLPLLREAWDDPATYTDRVPLHFPPMTVFAVAGECALTHDCVRSFTQYYALPANKGVLFSWPGVAAVLSDVVCGEQLRPCPHTKLLLCVQMLLGFGRDGAMFSRIMPRLLRASSLDGLLGEHRHGMRPPFYPQFVRAATNPPSSGLSVRDGSGSLQLACHVYERFCDEQLVAEFERFVYRETIERPMKTELGTAR